MQELDSARIHRFIQDEKIPIRVAFVKPNCAPGIVSLWYIVDNGKIYCAVQKSAKIVRYFQNNPTCGFEIAADKPPYKGIRGEGTVKILNETGAYVLDLLMDKYLGEKESILSKFLKSNSKKEIAIEITPQALFDYDYSKRMKGAH